jgi:MFS family permease
VSTAKSWGPSYEWQAVLTLSLAFGLVGLDRFILPPLFPAMMKDLDLNYQDLGNLVGALGIAWGVSAIVIGGLSDRLGRRRVLVPAVVLFSLLSVFSGMAADASPSAARDQRPASHSNPLQPLQGSVRGGRRPGTRPHSDYVSCCELSL